MAYEPLHHKYRPQTFAQLVGQGAIATTLTNAINSERIAPAYLFTGPRGTGKTSSARILAKSLNCLANGKPTPEPCGICDVCRTITKGSALDVIEIDAASNTGVDNIREIIERAQFAPVQCRYKVYVIDECLTGDSLITTSNGLKRIDDSTLKGQQVLSYNETKGIWEYKEVKRWLERGIKQTLVIKTNNREIRCTGNHLLRTEQGWTRAQDVKEGMRILSPVNVDAGLSSINMEQIDAFGDLSQDINSKATNTDKNSIICHQFLNKQNRLSLYVDADAENHWKFPNFCNKKAKESKVSAITGNNIPIEKDTESGNIVLKTLLPTLPDYPQKHWDLSMVHCSETVALTTPIPIVDSLDYVGLTALANKHGWSTKSNVYQNYAPNCELSPIRDTVNFQFALKPIVTPNSEKFTALSNYQDNQNLSLGSGSNKLHRKEGLGGISMMALSVLAQEVALSSNFIQKDSQNQKIKLLLNGSPNWAIEQPLNPTPEKPLAKLTITSDWEQTQLDAGLVSINHTQFPQWTTNFEIVESITLGACESVYDLEVEDNHNFVANGLLVHNCHMLSVAAFNALLKTLEEPPKHVVFVLATTDPQRVLPTIISRCQRFDYRRIPLDEMVQHLGAIAQNESIDINPEALTLVAQIANGGLRDAESLLDQLSLLSGTIDPDKVWDLVGAVPEKDLLSLIQVIREGEAEKVITQCRHLLNRGREPLVVLQNLAQFYLNLLIAKTASDRAELVAVTAPTWQQLCQEATAWQLYHILQGQKLLKDSEFQLKNSTQPRLWLEITLLSLLPSALAQPTIIQAAPTQAVTPTQTKSVTQPTPTQPQYQQQTPVPQPTQPQPEVISPPPAQPHPTSPPQTVAIDSNLNEIWQQVLNVLQPPSAKELLRQHCHLINFTGKTAVISVRNQTLLSIAKGKASNIETAFAHIFGNPVKVNLQIGDNDQPVGTNAVNSPIVPTTPVNNPPVEVKPPSTPPIADNSPKPAQNGGQKADYNQNGQNGYQSQTSPQNGHKPQASPPTPQNAILPSPQTYQQSQHFQQDSKQDIVRVAESLAQLFSGEVINLSNFFDDDSNNPENLENDTAEIANITTLTSEDNTTETVNITALTSEDNTQAGENLTTLTPEDNAQTIVNITTLTSEDNTQETANLTFLTSEDNTQTIENPTPSTSEVQQLETPASPIIVGRPDLSSIDEDDLDF